MTTDPRAPVPEVPRRRGRDLAGALTTVAGLALLAYAAFLMAYPLGVAVTGGLLVIAGALLAYEPPPPDRRTTPPSSVR